MAHRVPSGEDASMANAMPCPVPMFGMSAVLLRHPARVQSNVPVRAAITNSNRRFYVKFQTLMT